MHLKIIKEIMMLQHYHARCAESQKAVICEMLCKLLNQIPIEEKRNPIPDEDADMPTFMLKE
jgi:hypothetical protein